MGWLKLDIVLWKMRERDGFPASASPKLFTGAGDPNGSASASKAGDEYLDTSTWHKRYAQAAGTANWVEYNYMA